MQLRWLLPGMHVKRWLLLLAISFAALGLGIAVVLQDLYQYHHFRWPWFVGFLALRWLPHYHSVKAFIFFSLGVAGAAYAVYKLNASLLSAVVADKAKLVDLVYRHRLGHRGPHVVAIGGGHGLAILPPGDFRNCIAALSDAEPLMEELLQYRFPEGSGLDGHSFGNLYIAAMRGVTGNFEAALSETSRILRVRGQILPSTLADLTLHARLTDGSVVHGESSIKHHAAPLDYVFVRPKHAEAHPEAVRALLEADVIVMGPGSLYTSVLPNLLVEGIAQAVRASRALKIYVCNVATEHGETDHFGVADHVQALYRHLGPGLIDVVLVDRTSAVAPRADQVSPEAGPLPETRIRVVHADVVDRANPRYHDPTLLAEAVVELYRIKMPRSESPPDAALPSDTCLPQREDTGEYAALSIQ